MTAKLLRVYTEYLKLLNKCKNPLLIIIGRGFFLNPWKNALKMFYEHKIVGNHNNWTSKVFV